MRYPKIKLTTVSRMPKDTLADYDPTTCTIRILKTLPPKKILQTLMHELAHWALDKKFKNIKEPMRVKEESICLAMELVGSYIFDRGIIR